MQRMHNQCLIYFDLANEYREIYQHDPTKIEMLLWKFSIKKIRKYWQQNMFNYVAAIASFFE